MKKIIGLAIAAVIIMVVAGGGTFAFFSDTGTSSGDQIQAGTLYLTGGSTAVITSVISGKAIANGTAQDEATTLAITGSTITSGDYLSIKFVNMVNNTTGFPTNKVHDITGALVTTPGDIGMKGQMAVWVTTHSGASAPVSGDIELTPATGASPVAGSMTTLSSSTLTYYPIAQYIGATATGYAAAAYQYFNNVLGGDLSTIYFHITWKLPNNGANTNGSGDDNIQGVKVTFDIYFTVATVNNPYN